MTDVIEVKDALSSLDQQVSDFIKETNEQVSSFGSLTKSQAEKMKALEEKAEEMAARVLELEQKGAESGEPEPELTGGEMFVKSEQFEAFKAGRARKASLEVKNTIIGSDATVAPDRQAGIVSGADRQLRIADVLIKGNTTSNAIEYTRENVFTNNAAETAEAAVKPQSDITFTLQTAPVRTIAHWIKLSKQVIDDAPMLASYVDGRMRYGVEYRLDSQLLNGDGVGSNISGLLDAGNYTVFTPGAGIPAVDNIRKSITVVQQADYSPNAVILNPADVEAIDLSKDSQGAFIAADPRSGIPSSVWGLPIVVTNAMTAGQFLIGAFSMAAELWNRQGVVVELFEQDDTNVQSNLVTLRAEMRVALTVYRPASLVGGALTV